MPNRSWPNSTHAAPPPTVAPIGSSSLAAAEALENLRPGQSLPRTAHDLLAPRLITAGWACRYVTLQGGRRQILGFVLPGDTIGQSPPDRPLNRAQALALTQVRLSHARLRLSSDDRDAPSPTEIAIEEERQLLDHIVRLGRQTAYERTLHLLLELHERLAAIGLADGEAFEFPLTQEVLADALGLSVVHINRTLQRLRRERLLVLHHGRVTLLELPRMKENCDYGGAAAMRASAKILVTQPLPD